MTHISAFDRCQANSRSPQTQTRFSIAAQRKLLAEYADQNALEIVREFEGCGDSQMRSAFNEMVETLRATRPSASIILVEKTDRYVEKITLQVFS
jgi:DNA invertase Pin-like site-specific DNA recombinase